MEVVQLGCKPGPACVPASARTVALPKGEASPVGRGRLLPRPAPIPRPHQLPPPQPGRRLDVTCTAAGAGGGSASPSALPPWAPPGHPCGIGDRMDGEPWAPPEEQRAELMQAAPSVLGTRGPSEPPPGDSGPPLGCLRGVPQSPGGHLSAWL